MLLFHIFCSIHIFKCRENACILILCRNSDIDGISKSLKEFEATFNSRYRYPYVFLNDKDFTQEFMGKIKTVISAPAEFGKLTPEQWGPPPWIDMQKVNENLRNMEKKGIIYGGSLSYRNMCRFFSGYFYRHELVMKYNYYWRIEPDVNFFCDLFYDPFEYMRKNDLKYGFSIVIKEYMETIKTLWTTTKEFLRIYQNRIPNTQILSFMIDKQKKYNGCHFWSNFEIGDFAFFRSEAYGLYFDYLDRKGGFYYERWGDAPIHSIAASLFLEPRQVHWFEDIGYRHGCFQHCPTSPSRLVNCRCRPSKNIDYKYMSCMLQYQVETAEYLATKEFL